MGPVADDGPGGPDPPELPIPEIRDYQRVNAELIQLLDAGHRRVRLVGAEGQRLLVSGLSGGWQAVVEVVGRAGPELAGGLNAPGLTVVCRGSAADGVASRILAGDVVIAGDVGPAVGYAQRGGTIVVAGDAGPRAGLNQSGGVLLLLRGVGPLSGERQSGGFLIARAPLIGPHPGRGRRGGRFVTVPSDQAIDPETLILLRSTRERLRSWLPDLPESEFPPIG